MNLGIFLESISGIAGDMFAASFVNAGIVQEKELFELPKKLNLKGVEVVISKTMRANLSASHIAVRWTSEEWKKSFHHAHAHHDHHGDGDDHDHKHSHDREGGHWHTHYLELDHFLEHSNLETGVKEFARKVFRLLAEAEARAHGIEVDEVAFHEVGAVDSVIDVVMAATCLQKVSGGKISDLRVYASPVKLGRGQVKIEHGVYPVPPPAAANLAEGFFVDEVPAAITRPNVELSTPTGLAILKALSPEFISGWPKGEIKASGYGGGTMDLGTYPNVFRVMLFEESSTAAVELPYERDQIMEISFNIDDETAERTAWIANKLLQMGAYDVWQTGVTGKKGRMETLVSLLFDEARFSEFADWILKHSSTFGLRYRTWDRMKLARRFEKRKVEGSEITYKIGLNTKGEVLKEKPEFEEVRKVWDKT